MTSKSFSKEEEIRPKEVFQQLLKWVEHDAYALLETADFELVHCPACNNSKYDKIFEKHGYSFVECDSCFSIFVNPRPTKESLNSFFPKSRSADFFVQVFYPTVEKARKEKLIPERAEKLQSFILEKGLNAGVLVDTGAGQGFFLEAAKERLTGFEFKAIEPNAEFAKRCRSKGFETIESVVEENVQWQGIADIVTCFEVFEHVQNPEAFIVSLKRLLKPGGCLLITSLSGDGFDIQLLKEKSDIVAPPQHLNYLSIKGYKLLFEKAGFKSVHIMTPGKLDVEIVEKKIKKIPEKQLDPFVRLLSKQTETVKREFQSFLAGHCLSSHVWVFAINR